MALRRKKSSTISRETKKSMHDQFVEIIWYA